MAGKEEVCVGMGAGEEGREDCLPHQACLAVRIHRHFTHIHIYARTRKPRLAPASMMGAPSSSWASSLRLL